MKKQNIKLFVFDLDQTLVIGHSWVRLNLAMGVPQNVDEALYWLNHNDILSYENWTTLLLKTYHKFGQPTRKNIEKALFDSLYAEGAIELVGYLKSKDYQLALISGGIDIFVEATAKELGIGLYMANNEFIFDKKNKLTEIRCYGDDVSNKLNYLKTFCKHLKLDLEQCACIDDGDNASELSRATGNLITFPGSKLEDEAWMIIKNLSELKKYF